MFNANIGYKARRKFWRKWPKFWTTKYCLYSNTMSTIWQWATWNTKIVKRAIKLETNRKRQAEEEFTLIQGLAQSLAERKSKAQESNQPATYPVESFCKYVAQTMYEPESDTWHKSNPVSSKNWFSSSRKPIWISVWHQNDHSHNFSNKRIHNVAWQALTITRWAHILSSSPQNDSLCHNFNAPVAMWKLQNMQSDHTPEDGHWSIQQLYCN